ncbi:MAG: hypothetical protein PHX82_14555, partial [Paracoccaceae bacterium]|nr:hypothetical protein [Paracoccaceae bacterium]
GVVGRPVGRAVAGGIGLAHATRLTAWIHGVNPLKFEFCNKAHHPVQRFGLRDDGPELIEEMD